MLNTLLKYIFTFSHAYNLLSYKKKENQVKKLLVKSFLSMFLDFLGAYTGLSAWFLANENQ